MKQQIRIFALLLVALIAVVGYSLAPWTLQVGRLELKKIDLPDALRIVPEQAVAAADKKDSFTPAPLDTARQRILFFGDSMLEGLSRRFADYAEANGHDLQSVLWYSSTTQLWAETDTLQHFLRQANPTFIVICLGSNELFVRDLPKRNQYVEQILRKVGNVPYVWISPPNWKDDTGINDAILRHVGPHRYFDSRHLTLQRGRDGAHPTFEAAATWMDKAAAWMQSDSTAHPIRLLPPQKKAEHRKLKLLMPAAGT